MAFNPARLGVARRRRSLTKRGLAALVGLDERSIRAFENGEAEPANDTCARIAQALEFPLKFFLEQRELVQITSAGASFRSLRSMTARQRDAVLAAGTLAFELNEYIERRFRLPDADFPDLREAEPEAAARALREHWGIGERPIGNMVHLIESKGGRVFSLDREHASVDAFTTWRSGRPFVFLNTLKTAERARFDVAHELGHAVLHRHGHPQGRHLEAEANQFASAFLMPASKMRPIAPRAPTVERLAELKKPWGVSVAALAQRLHNLRLMTDWQHRQIFIALNRRGRKNEPNPMQRETSSLLHQVFAALREKHIPASRVASELHLTITDLNALIFRLVPTVIPGVASPQRRGRSADLKLVSS